jgi:hypothetical protein
MSELILRTTIPPTKFNNEVWLTEDQRAIIIQHSPKFVGQEYKHPNIEPYICNIRSMFKAEYLKQSAVYLITETVGDYPYPYFTEKTWKAMVIGRPFMIVGAQNSLATLREFGFKTFDHWWSEEYDTKELLVDRINCIIQELCKLSETNLLELEKEILPILEHNKKHLAIFKQANLENIRQSI